VSHIGWVDHVVLKVSDMEAAADFYVRVLGAERVELSYGRVGLKVGATLVNLHGPKTRGKPALANVPRPGTTYLCFTWNGSPESACDFVRGHGIEPELGPVARRGSRGMGESVYFRDPDGNVLELIAY
jgi:catechol 2,3-dioxygenase-like lactoylglutathione lyase family enzyme